MKLTLLQENLNQALKIVSKAVPSKPQLPILASLLLTVEDNQLTVAATDLYLGIRAKILVQSEGTGSITVPAKLFTEAITTLGPGQVNLEYKDNSLVISTNSSTSTIQCQTSEDYPSFPEPEGSKFELSLEQLEEIEKYVVFSAATDQARLVLTTVLLKQAENKLETVSTDGFRLSSLLLDSNQEQADLEMMIPAKALAEVAKIAKQKETSSVLFRYATKLKQLFLQVGEIELFIRLVEGNFPPYEKIIPTSFTTEVSFDTETFLQHLKQAMVFVREVSNVVHFKIENEELTLSAKSTTSGQFTASFPVTTHKGSQGEIAFNANYLLDFISRVKPEIIWFGMNDSLKPAVFKEMGNDQFRYIAMPFRLNE